MKFTRYFAAMALLVLAGESRASSAWTESVIRAPVDAGREKVEIDVTVLRPRGAGPFPIVVLSHGSPRSAAERRVDGRQRLTAQSEPLLAMGYAVIVPTPRGYGHSGGERAEGYGPRTHPDYPPPVLPPPPDLRPPPPP